jgi:competence protein ComEC
LSTLLILAIGAWLRAGPVPLRQLGLGAVVVIAVTTVSVPAASEILPTAWPVENWQVVACDVGQGDALVIRSQGRTALVDVGSDDDLINKCLTELSINRIDLLVLTHFDFDHVGGLAGALKSRKISQAIISGFPDDRPATAISLEQLQKAGVSVKLADPSISGRLGEYSWQILAPTREASEASDSNDASVVMTFVGSELDLLLLGDLGEAGQERITPTANKVLGSSAKPLILKVSHHGSNDQFAKLHESLRPELSLISVGETNGYGHPGKALLDLLERSGSKVLRTDLHGSIAVSVDSDALSWAGSG